MRSLAVEGERQGEAEPVSSGRVSERYYNVGDKTECKLRVKRSGKCQLESSRLSSQDYTTDGTVTI